MKLEVKHLAPYLPYGVICYNKVTNKKDTLKHKLDTSNDCTIYHLLDYAFYEIKPILKPLSDLTDEIVEEEDFTYLGYIKFAHAFYNEGKQCGVLALPYYVLEKLFQDHFDVFGLIDQGLAIDCNVLIEEAIAKELAKELDNFSDRFHPED